MSALSLATLGVQCRNRALSMATLGVFCGEIVYGGNQFLVFKPIIDAIKGEIPIDKNLVSVVELSETEFEIDGRKYTLVPSRTPDEIIKSIQDVEDIIVAAAKAEGVTPNYARDALYDRVLNEIKGLEELKHSVFNDDEEIIMILIATDAI